jgi:Cu2+-exporting ATPase
LTVDVRHRLYLNLNSKGRTEASIKGESIKVINPGYLKANNIELPKDFKAETGEIIVFILVENKLLCYITFSDSFPPEAASVIQTLNKNHIQSILAVIFISR